MVRVRIRFRVRVRVSVRVRGTCSVMFRFRKGFLLGIRLGLGLDRERYFRAALRLGLAFVLD